MSKKIQPHIFVGKGDIAEYVLLPGDPGRADKIAELFTDVRKVAQYRGFVTYTGKYSGIPVSVTSTGIGCPSACIALEELIKSGANTFIRVGTTGSIQKHINSGDIVIPTAATRTDGTTKAYAPVEYPAVANYEVTSALSEAAQKLGVRYYSGIVWTSDSFYAEGEEPVKIWNQAGVLSVEMECSGIFTIANIRGMRAGAILAVDGNLVKGKKKGEFEHGEKKGELADKVQKAINDEIRVALATVKLLEEKK
ncbi:MAG TPA: nucleoside phosphorylase [archaeon]|nr:nucleoside phosphorylase [archaeon]